MPRKRKENIFVSKMEIGIQNRWTRNLITQINLKIPEFKEIILEWLSENNLLNSLNYEIQVDLFLSYKESVLVFFNNDCENEKKIFEGSVYLDNQKIINLNDIPPLQKILKRSIRKDKQLNITKNRYPQRIPLSIFNNCLFIDPSNGYQAEIIEDSKRISKTGEIIPGKNVFLNHNEYADLTNLANNFEKIISPLQKIAPYIEQDTEILVFPPKHDINHKLTNHQWLDRVMSLKKYGLTDDEIEKLNYITNEVTISDFDENVNVKIYLNRIGNIVHISAEPYLQNRDLYAYGIRYFIGHCACDPAIKSER